MKPSLFLYCHTVFCLYALLLTFCRLAMGGLFSTKVYTGTELSATTKLSTGDETPPIANVLLAVRFLFFLVI